MYIVNTKVTIKIIQQRIIANKHTMELKQDHKNAIQKNAVIEGERKKMQSKNAIQKNAVIEGERNKSSIWN